MALYFARLPTDRLKRLKAPALNPPPLVVAEKAKNALRLYALDEAAARLGLHLGQPLANARAMVPELEVVPANPAADAALLNQLAQWCDRFTPVVALDAPDGLILEIAGSAHLFGDEKSTLEKIITHLREKHFTVQGAIANTALAARALARHRPGTITFENGEAKAVSPLPIDALQLDHITTHAFRRAGLKTIGQVASRKRSELVARFGASTLAVIDEALGQGGRPITPLLRQPDFWQAQAFAEPVATLDVIRAALQTLAANLCALMQQQGVGARHLEASFYRADGAIRRIAVETGAALREPAMLDRLIHERLATLADPLDPGFGFDLIRLAALRVEKAEAVAFSLDAKARAQVEIDFLADRLVARFGGSRLRRFHWRDSHIPEASWRTLAANLTPSPWQAQRRPTEAPQRPLRLFWHPEPVEISTPPRRLLWRRAPRLIIHWEGPERIAMEWWRGAAPARDYYRAEDDSGRRYWLYCELSTPPKWFLHGVFT